MLQTIPLSPPGEALSAGFAGVSPELARECWAEESPHPLPEPGAYEWWYFHALSPQGDGLVFSLFEGLPFHPQYLTQINRYRQRIGSSQKPWPELQASRYPAAYFAAYEKGTRIAQFLNLYPPESSALSSTDIRVGPNRVTLRNDGSIGIVARGYPYEMARGRPRKRHDLTLAATLTFTPTFTGVQHTRPFRAPDQSGASHHWVLAAPHGKMTGDVLLTSQADVEPAFELDVDTLAYHDHVYGHGGLDAGVKTLLWGFIQGETWTAAWHQTLTSSAAKHADGLVFFERQKPPLVIDAPETRLSHSAVSRWLLSHPGRIAMHGSDAKGHAMELLLTHPKVLDTAPFHSHLAAEGTIMRPGETPEPLLGHGATHILRLRRLRWPILSDLTLLAITPIPRDDPIWNE